MNFIYSASNGVQLPVDCYAIQAYMSQPPQGADDKRIQLCAGIVSGICLSPSSCISNFYS